MYPVALATGYWIAKVEPNGDWDYKTQHGYSPYNKTFCCGYSRNFHMHQTSEWIGNYNYGYTGKLLFSLSVLKLGSNAVSGFDPKDVEDYPANEEGYYDA